MSDWPEKVFGPKTIMAEPGFDPTLEPRRRGASDLRRGGAGDWLGLLFWGGLLAVILFFGLRSWPGLTKSKAPTAAPANSAASATSPASLEGGSPGNANAAHPTRTPITWPTLGVVSVTPRNGPTVTATPTSPTAPAASTTASPTNVLGPTATASPAPTQTARVIYQNTGGEPGPTQIVYVTAPPLPTYTPYPTYTPPPVTPTLEPSATPTASPTPKPTCPPPPTATTADSAAPGGWVLYLPLVAAPGDTLTECAAWPVSR